MNFTSEQVQAIRDGCPVPVVPPEVGEECVVLRRDAYEKIIDQLAPITECGRVPAVYQPEAFSMDDDLEELRQLREEKVFDSAAGAFLQSSP